ncbi:hypothetical protein KAU11_09920, partial [Candidatus Babeliales bacterium]|nr:hypothetical protein [Candidatus Babeliales bacterium]
PARFWVTNLNFSANFPSHEDARFLVERLAFFGFNAVRISHIDSNFEPAGIFKDIDPGLDTQDKVTGVLSSEQLDRLDYLIYTLKKQGIYVSFNLLIGRKFTEADGVKKARDLGEAAKPVTFFDPVLKRLQKKFSKDLLTHFNPYTDLRYCDDAAVSFIEIINEASLVKSWKADKLNVPLFSNEGSYIPVTYIWKLDHLWSIWLKNKYQTSENLRKSWGISEKGVLENIIVSDNAEWKLDVFSDARAELKRKKKSTIVLVKEATGTGWHVQYRMRGLKLAAGKIYVIRFTASSSSDFRLSLHAQKNEEPWQSLGLWQDIVITPKQKKYEIAFMLESENDNAQICFLAGYDSGKIKFSGLEIVEKDVTYLLGNSQNFLFQRPVYSAIELYPQQAQKDIVDFYISLQKEFFEEMTAFLRKECSIRIPVTGLGGVLVKEDVLSQKNSDFIDYHAYWDHPAFANGWSKNDFSMHRKSTMSDPQLGIVGMICEIQDLSGNKPFTISEWQHCYPNRFAYETPVVLASYAVRNGWDALYQFSFSHSREKLRDSDMKSFFDSSANPQQMILTAVASLIYHKAQIKDGSLILKDKAFIIDLPFLKGVIGSIKEKNFAFDAFDLKPHGNGAVLIFSPDHSPLELADKWLMVAVGEVKNKSSVWKKKGQFKWGRSPVMMKNIGVDVALKVDRFFQVYSLSDEGRSAHQIPADKTLHDFVFSTAHASSPWYAVTQ